MIVGMHQLLNVSNSKTSCAGISPCNGGASQGLWYFNSETWDSDSVMLLSNSMGWGECIWNELMMSRAKLCILTEEKRGN